MWWILTLCFAADAAIPEGLPRELLELSAPEERLARVAEVADATTDPDERNRLAALTKVIEALAGTERPEAEVLALLEGAVHHDPVVRAHAFRSARDGAPMPKVSEAPAEVPPAAAPPSPAPAGATLAPIAFSRLLLRVDDWILGELDDAGRQFIYDKLRAGDLEVVGGENAVFDVDHASRARFVLGGTLTRVSARSKALFTELEIEVEWELLDPYTEDVVYTAATTGYAAAAVSEPNRSLGFDVLEDAVLRLTARDPLRELLASQTGSVPTPEETSWSTLRVRQCEDAVPELPKGLEQAAGAAATVVASGGRSGSGVVVSPDGYVLTAAHVVEGDEEVEVVMREGPRLASRLVRIRTDLDVALLKLPGTGFSCLPVRTGRAPLGADVFAIGSPLGQSFEVSISRGIVSGNREVEGQRYVQTDAAVNPGSSGGPMLDAQGGVLALTAWKISGGAEGLAFGVPSDEVLEGLAMAFDAASDPLPGQSPLVGGTVATLARIEDARDPTRMGTLSPTVDSTVRRTGLTVAATGGAVAVLGVAMAGGSYARFVNDRSKSESQVAALETVNGLGWATAATGAAVGAWGIKLLVDR